MRGLTPVRRATTGVQAGAFLARGRVPESELTSTGNDHLPRAFTYANVMATARFPSRLVVAPKPLCSCRRTAPGSRQLKTDAVKSSEGEGQVAAPRRLQGGQLPARLGEHRDAGTASLPLH